VLAGGRRTELSMPWSQVPADRAPASCSCSVCKRVGWAGWGNNGLALTEPNPPSTLRLHPHYIRPTPPLPPSLIHHTHPHPPISSAPSLSSAPHSSTSLHPIHYEVLCHPRCRRWRRLGPEPGRLCCTCHTPHHSPLPSNAAMLTRPPRICASAT
jgi:hypothetical protein